MKNKIHHYDLLEEMLLGLRRELALKDQQLVLQAEEYERRLDLLNNENERIKTVQKDSIPREVYDRGMETVNAKIQINTDYINADKGRAKTERWVPWIIAALALAISYFKK